MDGANLCRSFQRPKWEQVRKPSPIGSPLWTCVALTVVRYTFMQCADIGSWYMVMSTLGFLAVLTNATIITFVGFQMTDFVTSTQQEAVMLQEGGLQERFQNWNLWALAMLFEHVVLLLRTTILLAVPANPRWMEDARELLGHRSRRFRSAKELLEQRNMYSQYKANYSLDRDEDNDESAAVSLA
eukprot:SAG31_NODE_4141_length_3539_cov_2.949419_4_plen_184_part_01